MFGVVLIVGLGLAGFATYMARNYISAYQTQLAQERAAREKMIKTEEVLVATRALKYGETLNKDDVRLVDWPVNAMPEGTFASLDALFSRGPEEPRTVLRAIEPNEAVLAIKVTEPGEDAGITSRLERGMRAFAISVDVSSGVSGFLRPGDRVDVYWTGAAIGNGTNQRLGDVTKLIETGVQLIAVDQIADGETTGTTIARTVTVSATPQQVASLAQAQSTGRLSLSLVGAEDETVAEAIEVDQRSLLGVSAPEQVVEAPKEEICTVKTRRGAEVVEIPIPCTN